MPGYFGCFSSISKREIVVAQAGLFVSDGVEHCGREGGKGGVTQINALN